MKKNKNRSPGFMYYPEKFEAHTRHLSDLAYKIFHRILNWMWIHSDDQCSAPRVPAALAVALAEPCERIEQALLEIMNEHCPLFLIEDDRFVSNGLRKEAVGQRIRSSKARKAAQARWSAGASEPVTDASNELCIPIPDPIPDPIPNDCPELKPAVSGDERTVSERLNAMDSLSLGEAVDLFFCINPYFNRNADRMSVENVLRGLTENEKRKVLRDLDENLRAQQDFNKTTPIAILKGYVRRVEEPTQKGMYDDVRSFA